MVVAIDDTTFQNIQQDQIRFRLMSAFQVELEFGYACFWRDYRSTRRKASWNKHENQKGTQLGYDNWTGNQATLVGGDCCHHYTSPTPASLTVVSLFLVPLQFLTWNAPCDTWLKLYTD